MKLGDLSTYGKELHDQILSKIKEKEGIDLSTKMTADKAVRFAGTPEVDSELEEDSDMESSTSKSVSISQESRNKLNRRNMRRKVPPKIMGIPSGNDEGGRNTSGLS